MLSLSLVLILATHFNTWQLEAETVALTINDSDTLTAALLWTQHLHFLILNRNISNTENKISNNKNEPIMGKW